MGGRGCCKLIPSVSLIWSSLTLYLQKGVGFRPVFRLFFPNDPLDFKSSQKWPTNNNYAIKLSPAVYTCIYNNALKYFWIITLVASNQCRYFVTQCNKCMRIRNAATWLIFLIHMVGKVKLIYNRLVMNAKCEENQTQFFTEITPMQSVVCRSSPHAFNAHALHNCDHSMLSKTSQNFTVKLAILWDKISSFSFRWNSDN